MEPKNEVTASNSHAALISELTEYRRICWTLIAEIKKVAHFVPNQDRASLLKEAADAERKLS